MRRVSNLFEAGAIALKDRDILEKAQAYRETLRNFQKRKSDKEHPWTDDEKEALSNQWKVFSDLLCGTLTTTIIESNNRLEKPFKDVVKERFLEEIVRRGTRVVARFKDNLY